jgi:hypothetical protein
MRSHNWKVSKLHKLWFIFHSSRRGHIDLSKSERQGNKLFQKNFSLVKVCRFQNLSILLKGKGTHNTSNICILDRKRVGMQVHYLCCRGGSHTSGSSWGTVTQVCSQTLQEPTHRGTSTYVNGFSFFFLHGNVGTYENRRISPCPRVLLGEIPQNTQKLKESHLCYWYYSG